MVVLASETPGSAKPRTSQHAFDKAVELEANGETDRASRFLTLALKRESAEPKAMTSDQLLEQALLVERTNGALVEGGEECPPQVVERWIDACLFLGAEREAGELVLGSVAFFEKNGWPTGLLGQMVAEHKKNGWSTGF